MDTPSKRIAVIGGGISGLAAAHRIGELQPEADVILLEASSRLGGVLQTEHREGFLVEQGADNFITTVPWAIDLCRRIGFESELVETNAAHRRAYVVHQGRLQPIPAGFVVMAPSQIWSMVTTPILSLRGKLRMAWELFVKRKAAATDESLATFVTRRLGREVYERLVQPLVSGIYTADPEKLSVAATLPQFLEMEQQHGSLTRAMLRQRKSRSRSSAANSGARYSQFVAPREGMSTLVAAIVNQLKNATVELESPVDSLQKTENSSWALSVGGPRPRQIIVDGVVLAAPAEPSSRLLHRVDAELAQDLATIEYGSCALITLGYRREQIAHPLHGFGVVVPLAEQRRILSASFTSIKYAGRAPAGFVSVRAYVGGACQSELLEQSDEQLCRLAEEELADLLAIQGAPVFCQIKRCTRAMPQYHVGHQSLVKKIETRVAQLPGLVIASNALSGVGIPNCIHAGEVAAQELLDTHIQPAIPEPAAC